MLRRVEIRSVIKVSLAFTLLAVALAAAVGVGLYEAGSVFGVIHGVDRLAVRVFNAHNFHLGAAQVVGGVTALAGAFGVLVTALLTIGACLFNLISNLTGGLGWRLSGLPPASGRPAGRAAGRAAETTATGR